MDSSSDKKPGLEFHCNQCGELLSSGGARPGESIDCPSCRAPNTVPAADRPPVVDPSRHEKIIKFDCPHCGQRLSSPASFGGREFECPGCAGRTVVPGEPSTAEHASENVRTVKFFCSSCGQKLSCDPRWAGHTIECPVCEKPATVPTPEAKAIRHAKLRKEGRSEGAPCASAPSPAGRPPPEEPPAPGESEGGTASSVTEPGTGRKAEAEPPKRRGEGPPPPTPSASQSGPAGKGGLAQEAVRLSHRAGRGGRTILPAGRRPPDPNSAATRRGGARRIVGLTEIEHGKEAAREAPGRSSSAREAVNPVVSEVSERMADEDPESP